MARCRRCESSLPHGGTLCAVCGAGTTIVEIEAQTMKNTVAEIECFLSVFGIVRSSVPDTAEKTNYGMDSFLAVFGCETPAGAF